MKFKEINLFDYKDYRKLLSDIFELRKSSDADFTFGKWAKEIGLSSVSGLTMVINGQRHAGKSMQKKIVDNLELDIKEADYFIKLVQIQKQAKGDETLMILMMDNVNKDNQLEDENRPIQYKWQMGFLREASKWADFNEDKKWLSSKCRINYGKKDLSQCLEEMKEDKILTYEAPHSKKLHVNLAYKPKEVDRRYFKHLHKDFLNIVEEAYGIDAELRMLNYRMLMLKKDDLNAAKIKIRDFMNEFIEEFDQSESDSKESDVYLTSIFFIPFSK